MRFFVNVAAENNSAVSAAELIKLLPDGPLLSTKELSKALELQAPDLLASGGMVTYRNREDLVYESRLRMEHSRKRIENVRQFVRTHPKLFRNVLVVAVSGSTSYLSSAPSDDLDLLIVTRDGKLWITLLSLLVYLRVRKTLAPVLGKLHDYCLSLSFTKSGFRHFLETSRSPLTARELINLRIIRGADWMAEAVNECKWIREYYPTISLGQGSGSFENDTRSTSTQENLIHAFLSRYLKFIAAIRNLLFLANGLTARVFRVLENPEMLMYESAKYESLKRRYTEFFSNEQTRKRYKHEYA